MKEDALWDYCSDFRSGVTSYCGAGSKWKAVKGAGERLLPAPTMGSSRFGVLKPFPSKNDDGLALFTYVCIVDLCFP